MSRVDKKRSSRKRHEAMKWIRRVKDSHTRWTTLGSSRYRVYDLGICRYVVDARLDYTPTHEQRGRLPGDTRAGGIIDIFTQMTFNADILTRLLCEAFKSNKVNPSDKEALTAAWSLLYERCERSKNE